MRSNNELGSPPLTTKGSLISLSNKRPLQKQSSKQGSIAAGSSKAQLDDLGHLYHVTIKIQEEMESKLTTPVVAPTAPGPGLADFPIIGTLNHT